MEENQEVRAHVGPSFCAPVSPVDPLSLCVCSLLPATLCSLLYLLVQALTSINWTLSIKIPGRDSTGGSLNQALIPHRQSWSESGDLSVTVGRTHDWPF